MSSSSRPLFVYFLLEDNQVTKRGHWGRLLRQRLEEKSQISVNKPPKERLQVWSAAPLSVPMWVYVLSVVNKGVGTAETDG